MIKSTKDIDTISCLLLQIPEVPKHIFTYKTYLSGVDNKKIASEKMHFEILCNKMVFSQKNIPRKKKKHRWKVTGSACWKPRVWHKTMCTAQ